MSEIAARSAISRMNMREVAVAAHYANGFESDLRQMASTMPAEAASLLAARFPEMCEGFGLKPVAQKKSFAFADGLAVIPVQGTLLNRFGSSYGFATGYNFIRNQLAAAMADEDVKGIVFDVNSFGGEAAGCFELCDEIHEASKIKPSLAVVDSAAYSAGYAIASSASKIALTPSGGVGSIGVVAMHMDYSKMLNDIGIKVTFIHFGDHKVDGNPYEPLPDSVKKDVQKGVNKSGAAFVALVARNRDIDAAAVKGTEAAIYRADEALSLGLIDTIATPSAAVQVLFDELSGSTTTTEKDDSMSQAAATPGATDQATKDAATAAANATAVTEAANAARIAERARVSGIVGCEEAKGKSALANHLAMNTDMSVDQAKAVLGAAAAEVAPVAAAPAAAANGFAAAMATTPNPNVGAVAGATEGEKLSPAAMILRDAAAGGVPLLKLAASN